MLVAGLLWSSEGGLHAMSMKRTKQRGGTGGRRGADYAGFGGAKDKEPAKSWQDDVAAQPEESFVPYALSKHFDKGTLIAHATFGKGVVLNVDGARVEVLFEAGMKKLGHAPA